MADYENLLRRAIINVARDDGEARQRIYEHARRTALDILSKAEPPHTRSHIAAELSGLESAIKCVEAEVGAIRLRANAAGDDRTGAPRDAPPPAAAGSHTPPAGSRLGRLVIPLAAIAVLAIAATGYAFWSWRGGSPAQAERESAPQSASAPEPQRTAVADPIRADLPYVFSRQPVYYRTTHPVGTLIVSRAHRFLYWIRPNVVAIRYGIGVGPECADAAGMFHILRKEEQPADGESSASAGRQSATGPMALRALYFGESMSLRGTNALASIGDTASIGCILVANQDSVELYDRVPLQEAVVISE